MLLYRKMLLLALLLLPFCHVIAKNTGKLDPIKIPKITGNISIDGNLDEIQWQSARKILVNNITRPYDNIPSPVNTEALLMENGDTFYIAFIAQDPEPNKIRAYLRDRDRGWGDDMVGIKIDSYNDQRTAYRFMVNALGVQIDGIESEVTKKQSDSWDGIWSSFGKITDNGFVVEMALPLRMLNFKDNLAVQNWGIELLRFYPREQFLRLSNIYLDRADNCEICQLVTAQGFAGAKQSDNLTITPAIVSSADQLLSSNKNWQDKKNTEFSLDVRWGVTPDILLNATINPDFSTVETDTAKLDINNNFALFFAEKRLFFLDNADYFDSNYNLIYTRNINAPNYGAKLTGRQNDHSLGVFLTDDKSTNILIPGNRSSSFATIKSSSKAAALRYRYNYNKDITFGWVSTLRTAKDYQNQVHGFDARFRLNTTDVVKFQNLYSNTQYPSNLFEQFCRSDNAKDCAKIPNDANCDLSTCDFNENVLRTLKDRPFSGNAFKVGYFHSDDKWFYRANYNRQNAGFRGDLGFISKVDQNKFSLGSSRRWYSDPDEWWTQFKVSSSWDISHNDNNELIEKRADVNIELIANYDSRVRLGVFKRDKIGRRFNKSSLTLNGNTTLFSENRVYFSGKIKPFADLFLGARISYGDAIDFANNRLGTSTQITPVFNWNINTHWEFKLRHTFSQLNADNANVFNARLTDLRTTYQFDVRSFFRFTLIYDNTSKNPFNYLFKSPENVTAKKRDISTELLYAYKLTSQTVFYLGYSDHYDTAGNFSSLEQDQRSIYMKFSYAWLS